MRVRESCVCLRVTELPRARLFAAERIRRACLHGWWVTDAGRLASAGVEATIARWPEFHMFGLFLHVT